ncbi:MAG TPA: class III poly(R)-hydroxyalkanoic acid synthase subunit PhaC [Syntrophales bacterium]|nr:class III poly(R)-hydroxyalkanoic acid synthase subunit PhaC [Syntrophales bacterium]
MGSDKKARLSEMMAPYVMAADLIAARVAGDTAKFYDQLRKAREVLLSPLETEIAVTPYDVVWQEDRVKLKHYHPRTEPSLKTPLFIVYAQVNRETMLDLQPGRSVVETFLNAGLDIYMLDWGYPTRKDRFLNLDDHINGYIDGAVDFILEKHGLDRLNIMAICQGGTMSVIYAALHPEKVKNLVLTVTPTNFDHDAGLLNVWARSLDPDKLVASYGNIPGDIMNLGFLLLNPARLMIDKYVGFLENIHNKDFVENFVRMERWIFDSPDLPGEAFREFIQWMFRENRLIKNELVLGGKKVDLKNITMPVLNIYGKYDHLVPPAACAQITSKIGSTDKEDLCLDTGHIGIYVSSKTQRQFGPKIIRWLTERDEAPEPVNGDTKKTASRKKKAGATAEGD